MDLFVDAEYYYQQFSVLGVTNFFDVMYASDAPDVQFSRVNELLKEHDILPKELLVCNVSNALESESMRRKGNEMFKNKQYKQALKNYNRSLMLADYGTEMYGHALANRSAVFLHLNKYELCLQDIRRTLKSKYPTELVFKLYERAGNAERLLGCGDSAKRNYAECLKRMDEATVSEKIKNDVKTRVMGAIEMCEGLVRHNSIVEKKTFGDLLGGRNENIPALSAFLELKCSKTFGRGVYATRDINPGDVVLIEEPYIGIPHPDVTYVCNYSGCLKYGLAVIPCPNCLLVVYCDEYCMQMDANDGHLYQCKMMYSIQKMPGIPKVNELVMKIFLKEYCKTGLKEYCSVVNNLTETTIDPLTRGFVKCQYKTDNFFTVFSLKSFESKKLRNYFFFLNCVAAELIQYLVMSGVYIPESSITTVGVSFVHLLHVLDFSFWKFADKYCPSVTKLNYQLVLAFALYPSIYLFNHSCDPNVKRSGILSNRTSVLRAVQPISKGSQLFISYGVEFHRHAKVIRETFFKSDLFVCKCQPCVENWPCGRFIPNRLSPLILLNTSLADTISLECSKFLEYLNKVKREDSVQNLNYLYNFVKLLFTNVKRPFKLYEDCVKEISSGHILTRDDFEYSYNEDNTDVFLYI